MGRSLPEENEAVKLAREKTNRALRDLEKSIHEERAAHIVTLDKAGLSKAEVGRMYGLTRQRISQIVRQPGGSRR